MAGLEAKAAELVVEACVRTESVRKCVLTSSLLACVWRQNYPHDRRRFPTTIDENCWSDESLCRDNKVKLESLSLSSPSSTEHFVLKKKKRIICMEHASRV
jgi:hypothetical protein